MFCGRLPNLLSFKTCRKFKKNILELYKTRLNFFVWWSENCCGNSHFGNVFHCITRCTVTYFRVPAVTSNGLTPFGNKFLIEYNAVLIRILFIFVYLSCLFISFLC